METRKIKMKKKLFKIILIIVMIINIFISTAQAFTLSDILNSGKSFINSSEDDNVSDTDINELSKSIFNILQVIAITAALVMILILGIKYITGSVEEQANVKKTMIPFIVGCIAAFGAFGIWKVVVDTIQGINL
jgi:hypothetical protein